MDQTQLLDWHGESDPEEPSDGAGDSGESPKPVGRLHLLRSKYGPEKDFWIYQGKNLIGRHDSCQICLPVSSVSKAHAVIEVPSPDGPHLLYDQESLNRTRRQRMVLLPHVRYSLQDGDTLVFGDVGCQYFMLDPQGAPESPDDSLEVPPTQPRTDTSGLVIEETPVPGRKMGFGAFLVQDSDREEEGEEVVNGVGKIQYLPVDDGSDSSTKHGARGHCSLASSMLLSPSATVVPESDEESGEPLEGGPSCPSLRLRYESDDAAPRSLANGAVTPLEQEMHPVQPGSAEAKVPPDSGRQPGAKGQGASADPSLVDFHLDSDTDMEDEGVEGTTSERPPVKDDFALELGSNTDTEQPSVVNPGSADNGQLANDIDSDTDIEEAEKNPSVLDLKAHQVTENRDSDMDAEGAMDSPGVASPESQESSLRGENSREGEERAGSSPGGDRPHEEVDSDTDVEAVGNPAAGSKSQLPAKSEDDDTDAEEQSFGAENQEGIPKDHKASRDSDTDVEAVENPAAVPKSQPPAKSEDDDTDTEEPSLGAENREGPPKDCETSRVSDMDVEVVENPAAGPKTQSPAKSDDDDTDAEELSLGAENRGGPPKDREASRDSDTDVEVDDLEPGRLGGAHPHSPQPARNKDSDADVEEIKGIGLQGNSDVTDNARGAKNTGVEPPKGYGAAGEQSAGSDVREPIVDTEAVEQLTSAPQNQHLLAISVDSDTDVEEAAENPNESSEENFKVTSNGPSGGNQGSCSGNLEIGPGEDEDSDTDVEVTSPSPKTCAAHNSDTDVEVVTSALPGKHLEEQDTQLVFVRPSVDGEGTASSAKEPKVCCDPSKEDEDTDAEGNGSHPGDESDTDDEGDSDLAVQATQCYLPAQTSSPKAEKARVMADPRCALEEEATQAFVFRSPSSFAKFHPGKICSSPLKDEDPDIYMLEATQPYCKEPATLSEEPTQAFVADAEEDTELFVQRPIERGQHHSEQAARPAVPISATGGRQGSTVPEDPAQPHTVEVSRPEPDSQPAGGAAAEESHKEEAIQTVPLGQVPPFVSSQPLAPLEIDKTSGSEEQVHEAPFEGGVSAEVSQSPGGAGQPEERCSEPAGGASGAEQLSRRATKEPSKPVALVSEQRRGLRSSAASSPPPLPERRSRQRRGWAGSADPDGSHEPVAPPARRRGLRQLANPTRHTGEPERKAEETKAEEANPGKTPSKGEPAVSLCQGRVRRSQRGSRSAAKPDGKTATAAGSPVTEEPARPRKRRVADAPEPVEEEQLGRRWTRSSRQSGGTSETTLSPKDSGKGTKVGQGPAPSAPTSGRRSRRQSTESKTAGATQSRSRSSVASAIPTPKVLFTGVIDEEGERVVTELGGSLAESVLDCTHLVTDRVCRTVKFLCALARGIPIVTLDWLEKSKRNSFFLSPKGFLVRDPEQEKNFGFRLAESLQKARQKGGLLQGYELHVTPNVKPEPEHMRDIIKCSGGTFLPRMPRAYKDKRIVISCPEDLPRCKPAQDAGVPIANSEFILTGILQQKADLDAHRLGGVGAPSLASPAASATRASKRRAAVATAPAPPSTAKRRR